MTFSEKKTIVIWAKDSGGEFHSIGGVNNDVNTDTVAVTQLNKLFAAVGKTIVADGMQLLVTKEAI